MNVGSNFFRRLLAAISFAGLFVLAGCSIVSDSSVNAPPERAKQLYIDHAGNSYYMWVNGVRDEYESYHVPEAQESEWTKEAVADLVARLPLYDRGTWFELANWQARDALPDMLKYPPPGDSWTRGHYAIELWSMANPVDSEYPPLVPQSVIKAAQAMALSVFREIATGPCYS